MGCKHNFPEFQGFISKNPSTVGAIFVKLKGLFAKWWVENMFPESLGVHMKKVLDRGHCFCKFKSLFAKRPISARSGLLIGLIRRPGEARDVATLPAHLIGPKY
jgi:hypothetical protein